MDKKQFDKELNRALPIKDRVPKWLQYVIGFWLLAIAVGLISWGLTWVNICFGPWCVNGFALGIAFVIVFTVSAYIRLVFNRRKARRHDKG